MSVTTRSVAGALAAAVGGRLVDDERALGAAAVDGRRPRWVASPASVDEVARVLAIAADERLAVVPRGAGTALEYGAPPARVDVVLELRGLDAILEHHPDDLTASVQAGVTGAALAARLLEHRQLLPVDPPGWSARTIGGIAATAASGPLRARYGGMRDLLLGVRFVQPDGVLTWGGSKVVKSVTGYDVPKLMVGALGTLGVLVELTVRLHPVPEFEGTWLASFPGRDAAGEAVAAMLDSTLEPSRVEWLGEQALARCGLPKAAAALAVSIGSVEPAVRAQEVSLMRLVERARGSTQSMGASFWKTYDRAVAETPGALLRIGTLPSRLAATVAAVEAALGSDAIVCGAATVGALRALAPAGEVAATAAGIGALRAALADHDGSVVIERAPLALRAAIDPWGAVPAPALDVMRRIRDEVDPGRVLNPGRFVGGL